jgi:hypothetical protein
MSYLRGQCPFAANDKLSAEGVRLKQHFVGNQIKLMVYYRMYFQRGYCCLKENKSDLRHTIEYPVTGLK